jgi:hypothetical protein
LDKAITTTCVLALIGTGVIVVGVSIVALFTVLVDSTSAARVLAGVGTTVLVVSVAIVAFFSSFNDPIAADRIGVPTTDSSTVVSAAKLKGHLGFFKLVVKNNLSAVVFDREFTDSVLFRAASAEQTTSKGSLVERQTLQYGMCTLAKTYPSPYKSNILNS